jgi:hypothetical protein
MKSSPQNPINSILRAEIESWRVAGRMSKESVGSAVLEEHEKRGGDVAAGVDFEFSGDFYDRAKKASQKLYRWLDGVAPLPGNMLPTLLAVMPIDRRLNVLNLMARPLDMEVRASGEGDCASFDAAHHASALVRENSEGVVALLAAGSNPTPGQLKTALKEVGDVREAAACTERAILAQLDGPNALRAVG